MAPDSFFPSESGPVPSIHTNTNMLCEVCIDTLDRPIALGCGNLVCLLCCTKWLSTGNQECPCCTSPLNGHTHAPTRLTLAILGSQLVECQKGCNKIVRAEQYLPHLRSKCKEFFEHTSFSPSRTTVRELLEKDKESPVTPTEKRVAGHLVKRLMAESDGPILQVPTKGQVKMHNTLIFLSPLIQHSLSQSCLSEHVG